MSPDTPLVGHRDVKSYTCTSRADRLRTCSAGLLLTTQVGHRVALWRRSSTSGPRQTVLESDRSVLKGRRNSSDRATNLPPPSPSFKWPFVLVVRLDSGPKSSPRSEHRRPSPLLRVPFEIPLAAADQLCRRRLCLTESHLSTGPPP